MTLMLGIGADHAAFRLIATGAEGVRLHQQAISVPDEMMSTEGDSKCPQHAALTVGSAARRKPTGPETGPHFVL